MKENKIDTIIDNSCRRRIYIKGMLNKGRRIYETLLMHGCRELDSDEYKESEKEFNNNNNLFYISDDNNISYLSKPTDTSLINLIEENWKRLYIKPQDNELVWGWENEDYSRVLGIYCAKLDSIYESKDGKMHRFSNYEVFEGDYPKWAKESLFIKMKNNIENEKLYRTNCFTK